MLSLTRENPETNDKQPFNALEKIQTNGESVFIFNPRTLHWYAYDRDGYRSKIGSWLWWS